MLVLISAKTPIVCQKEYIILKNWQTIPVKDLSHLLSHLERLTRECIISQNGQKYFINLAALTAKVLKRVRPF